MVLVVIHVVLAKDVPCKKKMQVGVQDCMNRLTEVNVKEREIGFDEKANVLCIVIFFGGGREVRWKKVPGRSTNK